MVQVATAVEVEKRRYRGSFGEIALALGFADGLERAVETVDIGLMVLRVVKLHNLGRDVRF